MLIGSVNQLTRIRARGWVRKMAHPDAPVVILITVDGKLVGRAGANTPRPDLLADRIGTGAFSFDIALNRDRLLQRRADGRSGRAIGSPPGWTTIPADRRALVNDDTVPRTGQDGGSNAIVVHMRLLKRLGFQVTFAGRTRTLAKSR